MFTFNSISELLITTAARPNDQVLIANIPNYITLGQLDLCRRLNILGTEKIISGQLQSGVNTLQKPTYWIRTVSMTIINPITTKIIDLERRNYEYCNMYTASPDTVGEPKFYAEKDMGTILIAPTPNELTPNTENYAYELIYHELIEPLTPLVQTNLLSQRYGDLLLNACTVQMFMRLQSFALAQPYSMEYEKGIAAAIQQDQMGITDRGQSLKSN